MKARPQQKKSDRMYNLRNPYEMKARANDKFITKEDEDRELSDSEEDDEENLSNVDSDDADYVYNSNDDAVMFRNGGSSLADIILQKLKEKEEQGNRPADTISVGNSNLSPKIVEVYSAIGDLLGRYRSGKLPKAVKVLPHLKNWEEILALTDPSSWSPAGTFAITKVFSSNLNAKLVQRYFNLVLLEKCRSDIDEHGKLNFHLYHSLKKALFKPSAFYKGILLPLLQSGTCSQHEAVIFSSVLSKVSIPAIHSAAALLKILELPYSLPICIFIKQFLMKKYGFPARVIDSIADYFIGFIEKEDNLSVIWHQTVLCFVQRYKQQFTDSQRDRILQLTAAHQHHEITSEIRRELSFCK